MASEMSVRRCQPGAIHWSKGGVSEGRKLKDNFIINSKRSKLLEIFEKS